MKANGHATRHSAPTVLGVAAESPKHEPSSSQDWEPNWLDQKSMANHIVLRYR